MIVLPEKGKNIIEMLKLDINLTSHTSVLNRKPPTFGISYYYVIGSTKWKVTYTCK